MDFLLIAQALPPQNRSADYDNFISHAGSPAFTFILLSPNSKRSESRVIYIGIRAIKMIVDYSNQFVEPICNGNQKAGRVIVDAIEILPKLASVYALAFISFWT